MSSNSPDLSATTSAVDAQVRRGVALPSIASGLIHLWVSPALFVESTRYGVFFVVAAAAQLVLAVTVIAVTATGAPAALVPLAGTTVNTALVCVYAISHTVGVGAGAHQHSDWVIALDLIAVATEVLTIGLLLALLTGARRRWPATCCSWRGQRWSCCARSGPDRRNQGRRNQGRRNDGHREGTTGNVT